MLSIVVPLFNEEESLEPLYGEIAAVAADREYDIEVIFVDDGSTDRSWAVVERLAREDARVRAIRFRRNFGKAAALVAGFDAARGEYVFTMDADLQDDPRELPRFLGKLHEGFDVVSGWKQTRHDPWHKVYPSWVFNWMVSTLTGVSLHDHNCGFKCYRREVIDEVRLYGELHRFVPVLAAARGFKVGEIAVHHRERQHGESKYGVFRMVKGLLDLLTVWFLTGFDRRPQHLMGTLGLGSFSVGSIGLVILCAWWIISRLLPDSLMEPLDLTDRVIFYASGAALIVGVQFMTIGFLAELITAHHSREEPPFSVAERIGPAEAAEQPARRLPSHPAETTPPAPHLR